MLKIGITGGIGSGKSVVSKVLLTLGYPVYDSDTRAKELVNEDPKLIAEIKELLGQDAYHHGEYNRVYVASRVFNDKDLLLNLNAIIHPAVKDDFDHWASIQVSNIVFKESALLLQNDNAEGLDNLIIVVANESTRLERVLKRDPFRNPQQITEIFNKQANWDEVVKNHDLTIYNNDSDWLVPQVKQILNKL